MSDYKIHVDWNDPYDQAVETITGCVTGSNVLFTLSHEYACTVGSAAVVKIYCDPCMIHYIDIQNLADAQPTWYTSLCATGLPYLETITASGATSLSSISFTDANVTTACIGGTVLTNVDLSGNDMAASDVDNIIIDLDALSTASGILDLRNNSVPTASSASARQSLTDRGWTCYYDS